MNEFLQALAGLINDIRAHLEVVMGVGSGALFIAAVHTWPAVVPKSLQDWWSWIRDTFQTAIPAARGKDVERPLAPPPAAPGAK